MAAPAGMSAKPCLCTSLYILQGLVDAYVANSQQAKAISYLTDLRDKMLATLPLPAAAEAATAGAATTGGDSGSSASAASESSSSGSGENAAATAAVLPGGDAGSSSVSSEEQAAASAASSSAAGESSSSDTVMVDPVGVQLLLGGWGERGAVVLG